MADIQVFYLTKNAQIFSKIVLSYTKWLHSAVDMIVREKSSKNEMNPSKKNKPERFSHYWNPRDLYITFLRDSIK